MNATRLPANAPSDAPPFTPDTTPIDQTTQIRRSRLAGERVLSVDRKVTDPPQSRASSLLQFLHPHPNPRRTQIPCRSVACPAIWRAAAVNPVNAVCQPVQRREVLRLLRSRSRDKVERHPGTSYNARRQAQNSGSRQMQISRSRLAGERVPSVDRKVTDTPQSRASSLPQFLHPHPNPRRPQIPCRSNRRLRRSRKRCAR